MPMSMLVLVVVVGARLCAPGPLAPEAMRVAREARASSSNAVIARESGFPAAARSRSDGVTNACLLTGS